MVLLCAPLRADDSDEPVRVRFGEGVTFDSGDGLFRANVRARAQLRAEALRDDGDAPTLAIYPRRLRTTLRASALKKLFDLYVQLSFAPRELEADNPSVLRDMQLTVNLHRDFRLRAGQMKVPFDRQRWVSSAALAFPDRADTTVELTLDRDIGVHWMTDDLLGLDVISAQAGVFAGDGRNRIHTGTGLLYVARVQLTPLGRFEDLDEISLHRDEPAKLAIAAAIAFNDDSPRARSTTGAYRPDARVDFLHANLDVLAKLAGLSASAALLARIATDAQPAADALSAAGVLVQLGAHVSDTVELVGRFARLSPIEANWIPVPNPEDASGHVELRPGANLYFAGHDAKLQASVGLFLEDNGSRHVDGQLQLQLFF